MGVELTPNGSYGANIPAVPRPLRKVVFGLLSTYIKLRGGRLLVLTTTGAKSGKVYRTPLSWTRSGENGWLIVASNGGAARHPNWYYNLARNPDKTWIEVDNRKLQVQAESLKSEVYDQAWRQLVAQTPGYGVYQQHTDRRIPLIRLTPKS